MRVDQIITLVWVTNVALFGGTGWVGWSFWQQRQAQRDVPKFTWPEDDAPPINITRWPGAVGGFKHVWETPLNGLVPPPPPPPESKETKPVGIDVAFKSRIKIDKSIESSEPAITQLIVLDNGQQKTISLGSLIDEWQLVKVTIDRKSGTVSARFYNPRFEKDNGLVEIQQDDPGVKNIVEKEAPPFVRTVDGAFTDGDGLLGPTASQAYRDPEKPWEWIVPEDEVLYWQGKGQTEILDQLKLVERPEGVEIAAMPPRGPLKDTRGFNQGDIVVSINDVAVHSMKEILAYFRGEGRGLRRYVFVIQRDGATRTQTYNVPRR